jgi:hypothetical protein
LDLHIVIRAHKQRPKGYSRGTINTDSVLMHAKEKMQHSFDLQVWDKIRLNAASFVSFTLSTSFWQLLIE